VKLEIVSRRRRAAGAESADYGGLRRRHGDDRRCRAFLDLDFAAIPDDRGATLRELLTDRVTVANPFDIHTYLWFDPPALGRVFSTVLHAGYDAVGFMLDCPPEPKADTASFDAVIEVFIAAAQAAPSRAALIASLPETISARIRALCLAGGVVPLQGQREALEALSLAGGVGESWRSDCARTAVAGAPTRRRERRVWLERN